MDLTLLSFWLSLALRLQINQFPLQLKRIYGIFKTNNEGSFDSIIKLKNDIQISAMQYASLQMAKHAAELSMTNFYLRSFNLKILI